MHPFHMNEDETFKRLKRVSYEELCRIRRTVIDDIVDGRRTIESIDNSEVYDRYGWTRDEYLEETFKRLQFK